MRDGHHATDSAEVVIRGEVRRRQELFGVELNAVQLVHAYQPLPLVQRVPHGQGCVSHGNRKPYRVGWIGCVGDLLNQFDDWILRVL